MAEPIVSVDDLTPAEVAAKAVNVGKKASLEFYCLACSFDVPTYFGAILATTVGTSEQIPIWLIHF